MNINYSLLALLVSLLSCQPSSEKKTMEEMGHDPAFQDKHETPTHIDFQGTGEFVTIPMIGESPTRLYSLESKVPSDNYLLVFHEWWGLNNQILKEAERLFDSLGNVNVLVLDLYDGEYSAEASGASKIMGSRDSERLRNIVKIVGKYAGPESRIASVGWCYGGAWSLRSAHLLADQSVGCVMYYGKVPLEELKEMPRPQADILGIFAEQDQHIDMVYARELKEFIEGREVKFDLRSFDADHAFANPTSPRYEEEAAQKANGIALDYLKSVFSKP